MHNLEVLHDGRAVVGDDDLAVLVDQLVHAAGPEGGADNVGHSTAGVDVGNELGLALRGVGSLLQEDD